MLVVHWWPAIPRMRQGWARIHLARSPKLRSCDSAARSGLRRGSTFRFPFGLLAAVSAVRRCHAFNVSMFERSGVRFKV